MTPEIEQLLALQAADDRVDALQRQLDALAPRLKALDAMKESAQSELANTEASIVTDDERRRALEERLSDHRTKQERNLAALDQVKRIREATAAMAQVEAGRRVLIEEEQELDTLVRRVASSRDFAVKQRRAIEALAEEQAAERAEIAAETERVAGELATARAERDRQAARVSRSVLSRYDRIRQRRRGHAVFELTGAACGCCDTALPIHRRSAMASSGVIDVCEACGVLLYAGK